ncbi:hypothetical protein AVEN_5009-1 [Araneus ventricosus]|uniref:Uncharacterized protein n=1 Tax=Araneus ventricosus TaxID=182803 RepID=A0A4Y2CRB0_ARAVE|nr:hypothetical protein AVEN_5009-1 [Araneus ventricosus]
MNLKKKTRMSLSMYFTTRLKEIVDYSPFGHKCFLIITIFQGLEVKVIPRTVLEIIISLPGSSPSRESRSTFRRPHQLFQIHFRQQTFPCYFTPKQGIFEKPVLS